MLYALRVTRAGGNTLFANMFATWETLSTDLKAKIYGRRVLQIYKYLPTERVDLADGVDKYDHQWQPIVITNPKSGRKALYVNELMPALIDGYDEDESRSILERLNSHVKATNIIYEHKWHCGDLMMWDNWRTMHARTGFPCNQTRIIRRYTIRGQKLSA